MLQTAVRQRGDNVGAHVYDRIRVEDNLVPPILCWQATKEEQDCSESCWPCGSQYDDFKEYS